MKRIHLVAALVATCMLLAPAVARLQAQPGRTILILTNNPAAGTEVSVTIPVGSFWRLVSARLLMVASAGAANREMVLFADNNSTIDGFTQGQIVYGQWASGTTHIANETRVYTFSNSLGFRAANAQGLNVQASIGDPILPGDTRIRTATTNIQAGDDIATAFIVVERLQ